MASKCTALQHTLLVDGNPTPPLLVPATLLLVAHGIPDSNHTKWSVRRPLVAQELSSTTPAQRIGARPGDTAERPPPNNFTVAIACHAYDSDAHSYKSAFPLLCTATSHSFPPCLVEGTNVALTTGETCRQATEKWPARSEERSRASATVGLLVYHTNSTFAC